MSTYNIVASMEEATVVAEYTPSYGDRPTKYQSEADLEKDFIRLLCEQGYEYLTIRNEQDLIFNLRLQLERLNKIIFTDNEWETFFKETIAAPNASIADKTANIQEDARKVLYRDDGTFKNIDLIDKNNIHNNSLQVINQYEEARGTRATRYDVTILVNGLPLVHVELKRRGIAIREAFNQINRYQRDSFWAASGLFEYVQIFVISNGTHTKYYSNTTREASIKEHKASDRKKSKKKSHSFEFTNYWADANNKVIADLVDFTQTFFAKHTLLNVLTRYCVFTEERMLLVMRPYQIAATERIISRIIMSSNYRKAGTIDAGGYIWHTTGSGKTLTSFKTAQLATRLPDIDKVLFVVDRKDLDYQTMREYDRFEKGAADGNVSTKILQRQLENKAANGGFEDYKIIITTIQKLDRFIRLNRGHEIFKKHVVLIFDECHRSQFGEMHQAIRKNFKNYHLFGFTGTPIFAQNAPSGGNPRFSTTEQVFGDKLHTYTIVDAINDRNVLPFRIDFINTVKQMDHIDDKRVAAIDRERALAAPERIKLIVEYILEHFDQKTKRAHGYELSSRGDSTSQTRVVKGFNSIFAVASIPVAQLYYRELKKQIAEQGKDLKIATIYSFSPNEEEPEGILPEEDFNVEYLDQTSRDFLDSAIDDYNKMFATSYSTSSDRFENYYKDLSMRVKNREIDLLLVVNMFLTGFDATTLNTLWVDKQLRQHGLLQAFSRTNRILNSVKTFGNIVCFRDLKEDTDQAISLFGDKDAGGIVLLKTFNEYYYGYEEKGEARPGYVDLVSKITNTYPLGVAILGEQKQKDFIRTYGAILRMRNILTSFDEFEDNEILSERDLQDYQSVYIDLYNEYRVRGEKENINDDLIFELELVRQIEVNIDYILMLVERYAESHKRDKDILLQIDRAIDASIDLRSKKELIERFIEQVNVDTEIDREWREYLNKSKDEDLDVIIQDEKLKREETRAFMDNAFRDGELRVIGTEIDQIMPPMSFFGGRVERKQGIIEKLMQFFEKYFGLI